MTRLEQIIKMLGASPDDAFLLYAAALEFKKAGQFEQAIAYLENASRANPDHAYSYYQKGQTLELMGRPADAAMTYQKGIEVAKRVGDLKASGELEAALDLLD